MTQRSPTGAAPMLEGLKDAAMALCDTVVAAIPQAMPASGALRGCKLVSHRGEHDNRDVLENTLPAFRHARAAGVWGIECDIRWTEDLVPIVCHDADTRRVFGHDLSLHQMTFARLRDRLPALPSLAEVVAEFGGHTHLMLELKAGHWPAPDVQGQALREQLGTLTPGRDYHLLALDPALFALAGFAPRHCCLPIAELGVSRLSEAALEAGYGGLLGHYLLLTNRVKARHAAAGQRIGTGFIASRNCLLRELNRGVAWLFSNRAVELQGMVRELLAK